MHCSPSSAAELTPLPPCRPPECAPRARRAAGVVLRLITSHLFSLVSSDPRTRDTCSRTSTAHTSIMLWRRALHGFLFPFYLVCSACISAFQSQVNSDRKQIAGSCSSMLGGLQVFVSSSGDGSLLFLLFHESLLSTVTHLTRVKASLSQSTHMRRDLAGVFILTR